jgi:hypothetical protein
VPLMYWNTGQDLVQDAVTILPSRFDITVELSLFGVRNFDGFKVHCQPVLRIGLKHLIEDPPREESCAGISQSLRWRHARA